MNKRGGYPTLREGGGGVGEQIRKEDKVCEQMCKRCSDEPLMCVYVYLSFSFQNFDTVCVVSKDDV